MLMNLMMLKVSARAFGDDMANDMPSITHTHSRKGYSNAFAIRAMRLIIVAGALLSPSKVGQSEGGLWGRREYQASDKKLVKLFCAWLIYVFEPIVLWSVISLTRWLLELSPEYRQNGQAKSLSRYTKIIKVEFCVICRLRKYWMN